MKKILFVSIFLLVLGGCKKTEVAKVSPTVASVTSSVVITATTANISGTVSDDGGDPITARGVVYGLNPNPTISDSKTTDGTGTGNFTSNITGLLPGKTYYFRTYATNSIGTSYGEQVTSNTPAILATVTTTAVTAITGTSASSGGNITADGGGTITVRGVCWGTATGPTIAGTKTTDGTGTGTYTSALTGLTVGATYYVRAYATSSAGTAYGNEVSFKVVALPTISTSAAIVITTGSITAGGNITSDGGATVSARGICWGTASGPTISGNKTSDGTGTGTFASTAASLAVSTTYYLRAYATNSSGTAYGNEITVTTLSQDVKNIVPDNIITTMTNLGMPIYTGKTPPNLVNFYKLSPRTLKNSNVPNDYSAGTVFYDMNIHFYNQDNTALSLKMDFAEMGSGGGTGSGKGAFISGSGNNFSVFMQVTYTASGQTADMVEIFSGTMTSTGIKDLYDGLFMVDDHGDPGNLWIANGQGRIFYDSDGMSPIIANLSSMIFGNTKGIMMTAPFVRVK